MLQYERFKAIEGLIAFANKHKVYNEEYFQIIVDEDSYWRYKLVWKEGHHYGV